MVLYTIKLTWRSFVQVQDMADIYNELPKNQTYWYLEMTLLQISNWLFLALWLLPCPVWSQDLNNKIDLEITANPTFKATSTFEVSLIPVSRMFHYSMQKMRGALKHNDGYVQPKSNYIRISECDSYWSLLGVLHDCGYLLNTNSGFFVILYMCYWLIQSHRSIPHMCVFWRNDSVSKS